MEKPHVKIDFDAIDEAIEKAKQLVALLREAQQMAGAMVELIKQCD